MLNRIFKFSSLFSLLFLATLVSCDKEAMEDVSVQNFTQTDGTEANLSEAAQARRGQRGGKCFKPVFPVTLSIPDGEDVEVADREAFKAAIQRWKAANPDADERPTIAFPFDVQLQDSSVVTISTEAALDELKATCRPERGPQGNKCFQPVFPVSLSLPDGTSVEVADREAARTALKAWKEANPDADERPTIAFPYDVELADGTVQTVENEEDLAALRATCQENRGHRPRPNRGNHDGND